MSGNAKTCPPTPSMEQKYDKISDALKSAGANQKCKSVFDNAVDSGLTKVDAAAAVVAIPFGGGGASTSFTDSQTHLRESLQKEGCSDVFMNVNQQMTSQQSILCQISNRESSTSLYGSANASVKIIQMQPTDEQVASRERIVAGLLSQLRPPPDTLPPDVYLLAQKNSNEQSKIIQDEIANVMGKVTLRGMTISIRSSLDMKAVSNTKAIDVTAVATQFKAVAKAQALSDIKDKTGLGANSDTLKSIVDTKLSTRNQIITDSIQNSLQSIKLGASVGSTFVLQHYGPLLIENVTLDEFAHGRLITENILTSASNMGSAVATEILAESHTSTKSDKESDGQTKLLKELLDGQLALSKANADGAANMFKGVTGFLGNIASMFALIPIIVGVVILLFFPQISNIIAPGPLKYVLAAVLMYFILAWFMGFWPFSKSDKSIFPHDGLAHVMTGHRDDPEGKRPYNFSVDQSWKMQ
tara:strand:+ start:131 stop:1543 length:1413 start_codon:yes stop_codon:yes gene_type:complete